MKISVFGVSVPVIEDKSLSEKGLKGFYDVDKKEIHIDSSLKGVDRTQCLLHECFHAAMFRTAMHQTNVPHDVFEIIVDNLATLIVENFEIKPKRR